MNALLSRHQSRGRTSTIAVLLFGIMYPTFQSILTVAFRLDSQRSMLLSRDISINLNNADGQDSRWEQTPFDFSSKQGWEDFYKNGQLLPAEGSVSSLEYEWHSHIPHSAVIETISSSIEAAFRHYSCDCKMPSILVIGCGNSSLPRILHDAFDHPVRVTCLDYSKVCIDMIQEMYSGLCPNMDFIVGDATKLKEVVCNNYVEADCHQYDIVIDKGLMDALMCGEGFDVDNLQKEIDNVLTANDWGMHVLICFPLIRGIKQRLVELGQHRDEKNLFWKFDLPVEGVGNGRASFNVGMRSLSQIDSEIVMATTSWN